jgi:PAS domain S-box-containing protein
MGGAEAIALMQSELGEAAFAEKVCALAAREAGGFAWICLFGPEGGVRRVAASGLGPAEKRELAQLLSSHAEELGLVGRALLDKKPAISGDIGAEAAACPLMRHCLERGYRSAAAFPLLAGRSLVGLLACGAPGAGAFGDSSPSRVEELGRLAAEAALALDLGRARAEAEDARRDAGEQASVYRASFMQSSAVKLLVDPALGSIVQANAAAERFYGYPPGVLATLRIVDINAISPGQVERNIERIKARKMDRFETRHRLASGEVRDVEVFSGPIRIGERELLHSIIVDVTEKKRAEAELERLVAQKDILMKELQHRVKNNLAVVGALLGLAADTTADEAAQEAFASAISRVGAIASVYEKLYASEDLETVDMSAYAETLARSIFATYNLDPGRITLSTAVEALRLDSKRCVPFGLALNELLSNALKYAYPGGERGEIRVGLRGEAGGALLAVEDDGRGIPEEFRGPDCESMGMVLLRSFARQLGGSLELDCSAGTRALLRFPL